ncbi:UPF0223 family protein [Salipaludibacillus sp. HK11]|uniref:UPF0223 family protein n=1 Tax=Salipaludibacillus sp. HK11 TaxID=3394320 RepID=UPI0039FBB2B6
MKNEVNIPLSMDWEKDEIVDVVHFYEAIDECYSKGLKREKIMGLYQRFKKVVPSKSEEKQHFKEYQKQTEQSPYHVVKKAKDSSEGTVIKI